MGVTDTVTAAFEARGLRRPYRLALPGGTEPAEGLVTLLHGCTQDAADVAAGTGMDEAAARRGWAVLYPEQVPGAHPQACWRWYEERHQRGDTGEAAFIAALVDHVAGRRLGANAPRWIAGLSAGAAMALNAAALRPSGFAGVGLHSGVPFGAAGDEQQALAAMAGRGPSDAELARRLHDAVTSSAARDARPFPPLVVFHGTADQAVDPDNARRILAAWHGAAALRRRDGSSRGAAVPDLPPPATEERGREGRPFRRLGWPSSPARGPLELWRVEGLGHAWSGGRAEGSYADPAGPSATRALLAFFRRTSPRAGRGIADRR